MRRLLAIFLLFALVSHSSCGRRDGEATDREGGVEVRVEVERLAASRAQSPQEILPYDEAVAWHEYRVRRVLAGDLDAGTIRVAHWTVAAAQPVPVSATPGETVTLTIVPFDSVEGLDEIAASDDLEVTASGPPRFLDLSQPLTRVGTPELIRYDYRGNASDQMRLYWKLRGQLRAVVMGNSHATKGISPRAILGGGNLLAPLMLNMAPAGSNLRQQCLMLGEYALPLPRLEWVLWVVSARNFNAEREDERKFREFTGSPAWLYDRQYREELWPAPVPQQPVTVEELRQLGITGVDAWGWQGSAKSMLPRNRDELRAAVDAQCDSTRFEWSDERFADFRETARALADKGIKVLVLTTPLHPFTNDADAIDPDGTTHEGFVEMVRHMEALDAGMPGLWFRDFHREGRHRFPPEEFYDVDHLNEPGAERLTGSSYTVEASADCRTWRSILSKSGNSDWIGDATISVTASSATRETYLVEDVSLAGEATVYFRLTVADGDAQLPARKQGVPGAPLGETEGGFRTFSRTAP